MSLKDKLNTGSKSVDWLERKFDGQRERFTVYFGRLTARIYGKGGLHYKQCLFRVKPFLNYTYMGNEDLKYRCPRDAPELSTKLPILESDTKRAGSKKGTASEVKQELRAYFDDVCTTVYNIIISSLTDKPYQVIAASSVEIGDGISTHWFLQYHCSSGGTLRVMELYYKLFSLKYHKNLDQYTFHFRSYLSSLSSANQPTLPPALLAALYLNGLDDKYEGIINAVITDEQKMSDLDTIITSVQAYDVRRMKSKTFISKNSKNPINPNETAYSSTKEDQKETGKKLRCFNCKKVHVGGERQCKAACGVCGKKGHARYSCSLRKSRMQSGDRKDNFTSSQRGYIGQTPNTTMMPIQQPYYYPPAPHCGFHAPIPMLQSRHSTSLQNSQPFSIDEDGPWFYVDSGASCHQVKSLEGFSSPECTSCKELVRYNDGSTKQITKTCKVNELGKVKLIPGSTHNLLSVSQLIDDKDCSVVFTKSGVNSVKNGLATSIGIRSGNMYVSTIPHKAFFSIRPSSNPLYLLHVRLGHVSPMHIIKALLNKTLLISPYHSMDKKVLSKKLRKWLEEFHICATCGVSKITRHSIKKILSQPANSPMHTLHLDRCGPSSTSREGFKYWLPVVDGYSAHTVPLFTADATSASLAREFSRVIGGILLRLRKIGIYYISHLKSDNEKAIIHGEMKRTCEALGIRFYPVSAPYRSRQNGKAERQIRTITEMVRVSMKHYGAPANEWAHAIRHACHHLNRIPKAILRYNTPYALFWSTVSPGLDYLRPFYCPVFCKTDAPLSKTKRFLPVGFLGNLLGYPKGSQIHHTYLVRVKGKAQPVVVRNVYFVEDLVEAKRINALQDTNGRTLSSGGVRIKDNSGEDRYLMVDLDRNSVLRSSNVDSDSVLRSSNVDRNSVLIDAKSVQPTPPVTDDDKQQSILNVRKLRANRGVPPNRIGINYGLISKIMNHEFNGKVDIHEVFSLLASSKVYVPKSHWDALRCIDKNDWLKASSIEIGKLERMNAWTVVKRPEGKKIMNLMFTCAVKTNEKGDVTEKKARLVARGDTQRPGIDYKETFSPTVKQANVRLIIMLSVLLGLDIMQFDFASAFLYASLQIPVLAEPPPGLLLADDECLLIKRALYGMCNSSREWYLLVSKEFKLLGFKASRLDSCLYYRRSGTDIQLLGLHVDDGILAGPKQLNLDMINKLKLKYKLKAEPLRWYLGMHIKFSKDRTMVSLSMEAYIVKLAEKYRVVDSKRVSTPLEPGIILSRNKGKRTDAPYLELVGALIYLMCAVRPDISFAVHRLSKYMSNPSDMHWMCAKRVLTYVFHTKSLGIVYSKAKDVSKLSEVRLTGYCDSDGHGDVDKRRSTTGYLIMMSGNVLYYKACTQSIAVDNMCEAEFISGCTATHELVYFDNILSTMCEDMKLQRDVKPMKLFVDNNAAIKVASSYELSGRSKHLEKKFWHLKDKVHYGDLTVHHIRSEENPADLFTKSPSVKDFVRLRSILVSTLDK